MADDDGFTFFLPPVVEGEAPAINVVYLIDISSSMGRASDGGAASPSSPSRLDLAKQALLALNPRLIDDGLADRATIKIVAFRADTGSAVIAANSVDFNRPDDRGPAACVNPFPPNRRTTYTGQPPVSANGQR